MTEVDSAWIVKLVGGGGAGAALLYLLYLVGMRIVSALDRVAGKVDDQGQALERVEVKLDWALGAGETTGPIQMAPSPRERRKATPERGVQTGYGPMRPGPRGGE